MLRLVNHEGLMFRSTNNLSFARFFHHGYPFHPRNKKDPLKFDKYGTDLTDLVNKEKPTQALKWREKEVDDVMKILCKKSNNNPCLLGTRGLGFTLIVQELVRRIASDTAQSRFHGKKVICLERDKINGKFSGFIRRAKKTEGKVIFLVTEADTLKELGHAVKQCVGFLTHAEYKQLTGDNANLRARLQPVYVHDPSVQDVFQLLKVLYGYYEAHHNVRYSEDALAAAATLSTLSTRTSGNLLDKAIDIIDEAGAHISLLAAGFEGEVTEKLITKLFPWEPIPVDTLEKSKKLIEMEESLRKHIIGQTKAVEAVSRALLCARAGLKDPKRPIGSFIFTGSTGVGKTELANAMTIEHFGSMENLIRLDMSEYDEEHTVSRLYGAPPGYIGYDEGGQLTEAVRKKPNSVILFDEIEKAHRKVYDGLLQILEDGRLTDGRGETFDFSNTIIIMTSNLAHHLFNESTPKTPEEYHHLKMQVKEELLNFFRPEFLNRLDDVILFDQLRDHDDLRKILEVMLKKVYGRLKDKDITIEVKDRVKDKLIKEGYDPVNGARPLRRCVNRVLEDRLAQWIADEELQRDDYVCIDLDSVGNLVMRKRLKLLTPLARAENNATPPLAIAENNATSLARAENSATRITKYVI